MSLRRFNGSCSSSASSSKKKNEKKLDGRCFCGMEVALMKSGTMMNPDRWFIRCSMWAVMAMSFFSKIEEGWEGLARSLVKRNTECSYASYEDGLTKTAVGRENHEVMSMMARKMEKIRGEIRTNRVLLAIMALGIVICVACNLYLVTII